MDIITHKFRSLSEDYNTRSPNTQYIIQTMTGAIPTSSNYKEEYTNIDEYNKSSPRTKANMVTYNLVPPNFLSIQKKK
jgi:hypothetical protein